MGEKRNMSIGRQWKERIRIWIQSLEEQFYRSLGEVMAEARNKKYAYVRLSERAQFNVNVHKDESIEGFSMVVLSVLPCKIITIRRIYMRCLRTNIRH